MVTRNLTTAKRGLTLLPMTLAAVLLAACSHRHEAEPEQQMSIKDNAPVAAAQPARAYSHAQTPSNRPVPMPRQRLGGDMSAATPRAAAAPSKTSVRSSADPLPAPAPTPKVVTLPPPAPAAAAAIVKDVTPKIAKAEPAPASVPPASVPMPPANVPPPITPKSAMPATPEAPQKSAAAPVQPETLVVPKVELIPAPMTDAPAPVKPVVPPVTAKPEVKLPAAAAGANMIVKGTDAAAKPATSTKTASLSEQTRVKDALDRADQFLKTGQAINARALLQEAARGENADLLTALAATYDPIVLKDYPASAKAADAKRAVELYDAAISKGSVAAKDRLTRLKNELSKTQ